MTFYSTKQNGELEAFFTSIIYMSLHIRHHDSVLPKLLVIYIMTNFFYYNPDIFLKSVSSSFIKYYFLN